jgi:hypothetical protein
MPSAEEMRALNGRYVTLTLTPAGGGGTVTGRVVGTLDAADGLVVIVEPDGETRRVSLNYQHIDGVQADQG